MRKYVALLSNFTNNDKEATHITIRDFARELVKRGYSSLIVSEGKSGLPKRETVGGVKILRLYQFPGILNHLLSYVLSARKVKERVGIVHSFSSAYVLVLRSLIFKVLAPNTKGAKVVHTLKSYPKSGIGTYFGFLLNFADAVTVPTRAAAKVIEGHGCKREKINVIHSHIDTKKFRPMNKNYIKNKYGYSGKKIIMYYGPLRRLKGVDDLMKSLPYVIKHHPDALAVFAVRGGSYNKKYDALTESLGVRDNVEITLEGVNIAEYVNMADAVVLAYPSLRMTEGNPSCLLESMACKTPVITTRLPEIEEIVGESVEMVPPINAAALAKKLVEVLRKPNKKKLAEAYWKAQEFSVEKAADSFISLYESLK